MTCPRCKRPAIVWRSTCDGLAVEACAGCHVRWRRLVLAGLMDDVGRTHTAAILRGMRCAGPCAECDAIARSEAA